MQYAKLLNGVLTYAPAKTTDYTGYKPVTTLSAPTRYHKREVTETEDTIVITWRLPNLATLKALLREEAEERKSADLLAIATITVEGVGDVVYDQQAVMNIMALIIKQKGASYVMADDNIQMLTLENVVAISDAFEAHVNGIYAVKAAAFAAIDAADAVEELLTINQ